MYIYSTTPTEESRLDNIIISLCINILFNHKECCNHRITTEISTASLTTYNNNFYRGFNHGVTAKFFLRSMQLCLLYVYIYDVAAAEIRPTDGMAFGF